MLYDKYIDPQQEHGMERSLNLKFRRGDLIAILLVIAIAVGTAIAFFSLGEASSSAVAQVFQAGRLIGEYPLETDATVEIDGAYTNTVSIMDGKVAIVASSCPGNDCVHIGWIGSAGRSIVCLPNRVEIRIVGASDVDFVVG